MICLHIRGNPGCDERVMELLSHMATTTLRHPIFSINKKNSDTMGLLLKWINEQRGTYIFLLLFHYYYRYYYD